MTDTMEHLPGLQGLPGRLRDARGRRTLAELEKQSGISQPTWSNAMSGRCCPSLPSLDKMASTLGVDLGWLIMGSGTARAEDQDVIQVNTRLLSPRTKQLLAIFNKASVALSAALKADADNY